MTVRARSLLRYDCKSAGGSGLLEWTLDRQAAPHLSIYALTAPGGRTATLIVLNGNLLRFSGVGEDIQTYRKDGTLSKTRMAIGVLFVGLIMVIILRLM